MRCQRPLGVVDVWMGKPSHYKWELKYQDHVNWNILVTWGKEIVRDSLSSDDRTGNSLNLISVRFYPLLVEVLWVWLFVEKKKLEIKDLRFLKSAKATNYRHTFPTSFAPFRNPDNASAAGSRICASGSSWWCGQVRARWRSRSRTWVLSPDASSRRCFQRGTVAPLAFFGADK